MKQLANLGDVNPLDYGGFFVTADEISVVEGKETNDGSRSDRWEVSRFSNTRCYPIEGGGVSDNEFHKDHPAWFGKDLESVSDSADNPDIRDLLCSEDPVERAIGYRDVVGHWGVHEFDQHPVTLTRTEVKRMLSLY
jgi:hypothetical protein